MNCTEFRDNLEEALDGRLDEVRARALWAHAADCADCRAYREAVEGLRRSLRGLAEEEPPFGLTPRVLARAREARRRRHRQWLGGALAAGLAVGVAIGVWLPAEPGREPSVAEAEERTVTVRVQSSAELPQAELTLRLPDHMELRGYPGERELRWRTALAEGDNWLELPLRVLEAGDGGVSLRVATTDGRVITESVVFGASPEAGLFPPRARYEPVRGWQNFGEPSPNV